MRDPRETLASIRKRADKASLMTDLGPLTDKDWALCAAAARQDVPRLVDALEKVLDLHRRSDHTRAVGFPRADRAEHYCVADQQPWPCPTDVTVTAALAGVEGEG